MQQQFDIIIAGQEHTGFATIIAEEMESSAKARGTGIAQRTPEYIAEKMLEGKAVVAFSADGIWAGFCYIETWSHGQYVANSGLIVAPQFRKAGLAKAIKKKIFELSRQKFPSSKLFGLTTGLAVMKINSDLGYEPVTYSELTQDDAFWAGCKSCINFDILVSKERKNCMCTAMLYDPADRPVAAEVKESFKQHSKLYERFMRIKQSRMVKALKKKEMGKILSMFSW
jgi:GNAT superfamily N-acetyltransferase